MLRFALPFVCLACVGYGHAAPEETQRLQRSHLAERKARQAAAQSALDVLSAFARLLLLLDAAAPSVSGPAAGFFIGSPPLRDSRIPRLKRSEVLRQAAAAALAATAGNLARVEQVTAIPPPDLLAKAPDYPGAGAAQERVEPAVLYTPPSVKGASTPEQIALAKHLEQIGAKFYGTYWCPFCDKQRQMFGAGGSRQLPYVECAEDGYKSATSTCRVKEVAGYPTWEINGKFYGGMQTLQGLQAISGFDSSVKFPAYVPPAKAAKPPPPPGGYKPPAVEVASTSRELALAKHLKNTGAKFYGAYWCRFCNKQREVFGAEATKLLPYVECTADGYKSASATCAVKQVDAFPTWEIGGQFYSGAQSFDELAKLSGFKDPKGSLASSAKGGSGEKCDDCVVGGSESKKI